MSDTFLDAFQFGIKTHWWHGGQWKNYLKPWILYVITARRPVLTTILKIENVESSKYSKSTITKKL